jgi:penicillin-binding protein 1A
MLYGSLDIYKDGFTVYTTLDLDYQAYADKFMARGIEQANREYVASSSLRLREAESTYIPLVEMLGLAFNLEPLFVSNSKVENRSMEYYRSQINPTIESMALLFGIGDLKLATKASNDQVKLQMEKATVEGALITIENDTGHIKAIVGGSKFDQSNQLIRATQSLLMPGSSFKPLYYSAAIDTRKFTEGTLIYDTPVVFYNDDGTPYIPLDYRGEWKGPVLTWYALAHSMNVPSVKVLDAIGFDAAINRAAALLDITDPAEIRRTFPRLYPLALGVIGVSPLKMARAYSIFANQGREVTPIAIRSVEDRQGRVFLEPEKELRTQQKKKGSAIQIISPQNAYVMVDMLKRTVSSGTLAYPTASGRLFTYKDEEGKKYTIPAAGKTGTTQNWADAWTVGFTPYMTTAVWFGFDRPGNSLGVTQSGAAIAGVLWANYMEAIHRGLPYKDFIRPQSGLVDVRVCAKSGLLPTEHCNEGLVTLTFYEGTQPHQYCDLHQFNSATAERGIQSLSHQGSMYGGDVQFDPTLKVDIPGFDDLLNKPTATPTTTPPPAQEKPTEEETAPSVLD